MSDPVTLLSTREVSQRLNITPRHVTRLAKTPALPPHTRVPGYRGALLFDPVTVDRYIELENARFDAELHDAISTAFARKLDSLTQQRESADA